MLELSCCDCHTLRRTPIIKMPRRAKMYLKIFAEKYPRPIPRTSSIMNVRRELGVVNIYANNDVMFPFGVCANADGIVIAIEAVVNAINSILLFLKYLFTTLLRAISYLLFKHSLKSHLAK